MECVDLDYMTPKEIAEMCGYPVRTVRAGIQRARGLKLDLATVWEIEWRTTPNAFKGESQCELHNWEDIPKGLAIGCLACLKSGLDHLIMKMAPKSEPDKKTEVGKTDETFAKRHHPEKKPKAPKKGPTE